MSSDQRRTCLRARLHPSLLPFSACNFDQSHMICDPIATSKSEEPVSDEARTPPSPIHNAITLDVDTCNCYKTCIIQAHVCSIAML